MRHESKPHSWPHGTQAVPMQFGLNLKMHRPMPSTDHNHILPFRFPSPTSPNGCTRPPAHTYRTSSRPAPKVAQRWCRSWSSPGAPWGSGAAPSHGGRAARCGSSPRASPAPPGLGAQRSARSGALGHALGPGGSWVHRSIGHGSIGHRLQMIADDCGQVSGKLKANDWAPMSERDLC